MIIVEDFDEIKRSMELPDDNKIIKPEDWIYEDERQELRFGNEPLQKSQTER